jgi:hypothetical protein
MAMNGKMGLTVLRLTLGIVVPFEAILFVLPGAAHSFSRTHMPAIVRMILGFGEIAGCVLILVPQTAIRGAWLLLAVLVFAILLHLLHGMYDIGNVVVYAAAAFAIATGKS